MQYILNEEEYKALKYKADKYDEVGETVIIKATAEYATATSGKAILLKIPTRRQKTVEVDMKSVFAVYGIDFDYDNVISVEFKEGKIAFRIE